MVPCARTGGNPGNSAPEKPQAVNYMHQALLRRGKAEAKRNKEVILLGSVASTASSFHLYQLVGYSQEPLRPHVTLQVSTHLCTIRWA